MESTTPTSVQKRSTQSTGHGKPPFSKSFTHSSPSDIVNQRAMAQTVVLREFLLAVERPKQPLDAAIQSFAQALVPSSSTASVASTSGADELLLATKFLEIQPHADAFLHTWPDQHGAGSRWEKRESIAVFFRVLSRLLRVQTQRNAGAAEVLALKVIREKNASLEKVLTWSDKPIIEYEALELMTALVGVNGAVAREFVRLFNFQSAPFGKLATRRMKKPDAPVPTEAENEDVQVAVAAKPAFQIREAYVRLVLALTACPDKSVHRFAMKEGGLTASLFKSIDGDSVEMLSHLFERLKELVLHNASVDDKTKLVIFNGHCVHQVLPLLQSDEDSIAQMALEVLNALFFDASALYVVPQKHALRLFLSKATATVATDSDEPSHTSEQAYAVKVIRNAIVTIGVNEYVRSAYAQTLVALFITKYPGLAAEYLQALSIQLEPKPGYRWFCVASLVQKLLSCPLDAITTGFPKESGADVPSWCSSSALATRLILPLNCRKELSRGIQHANNLIIYSTLGVMEVALRRYQFLVSLAKHGDTPAISPAELENELRFLLPSPEALVSLLLKLCSSVDQVALIYVRALVVFRLYLECLPQAMSEVKLDFTKILAWGYLESNNSDTETKPRSALASLIVSEILRFLLTVDANRLHVLLPSGAQNNNSNSNSNAPRSKLLQLLTLYVQTPNQAIQKLCAQVLQRTLLVSTVFGNDATGAQQTGRSGEETAIWLDSLRAGGDQCAAFMEKLVQSVLADPFRYLETYRARSANSTTSVQALSLSPGTIALVTFLNQPSSSESDAKSGGSLAALRSEAQVVVFGTRVLLSLLSTTEAPQQLVSLITSIRNNSNNDDNADEPAESEGSDAAAKKRKRAVDQETAKNGAAATDVYEHLVQYCEAISPSVHLTKTQPPPASKKLKESSKDGHNAKWVPAKSSGDFITQLLLLSPSAFVSVWEQIVDNCFKVTGSFDIVFHYLGSWVGGNLVDIFQTRAATGGKKHQPSKTKESAIGERFKNELPLHIVLQSVLFTNNSLSANARDAIATLAAILKQRVASGALEITEAVRLCEQLLFALNNNNSNNSSSLADEDVCNLLLHVLSFVIVSAKSIDSPLLNFQIARILRKLNGAANDASSTSSPLGRKLSALEISGLRLFYSEKESASFEGSSFASMLERSGIPSVVLLSSHFPADLRIRLLHKFLNSSSGSASSSVQDVLLQHLLQSLDDENATKTTVTFESFSDYKKSKLLARKLWELLERTGSNSTSSDRGSSFYSSSFSVLGKLGGVQADIAHKAIDSTLVPIVVSAASGSSTAGSVSLPEMLRRIMLSIRSDSSVTGAALSQFSRDLESALVKKLQQTPDAADKTVSYSLLSGAYDVFTRIESPELLAYANTLVGDCFVHLMQNEEDNEATQSLRLSFLRHALLDATSSNDLAQVVSGVFKTLSKQHPDGKILSATQQAALLLVMRSSGAQSSKTQEMVVVFLVKCGLQALKALSKAKDVDGGSQEAAETDKFLAVISTVVDGVINSEGVSPSTLVAILKTLSPQFARAQDYNYSTVAAYMGFVKLSAVFLKLVIADESARKATKYDFSDHLSAITENPLFVQCLENKLVSPEAPLALIRVVYWLVQVSGVYDRKLFKVLLSVYAMSLSAFDRVLRILFEKFDENAGISLSQFGFRFGSSSTTILSAAEDAVEPGQSRADLVDDSVWLISGGLEQTRIRATVEYFPLDREVATTSDLALLAFDAEDPSKDQEQDAKKSADRLLAYDPAFLLPMLSHFISSSDLPDAAVVQQGLLGIAVRATSSNADCIRAYAYGIVAHMHESLTSESSDFKAGRQIHLMLESFRNSIQEPLEGVSSVITVFMNDAISILCRPVHAMYPHLNHFLLARPAIDVNDVPMFYSLFNSRAPLTYKQERSWFLHTLRRGVCEDVDVMLLVRRHVLPILMSFFSSELADEHTQVLIGQILNSCLKTESGASYLISKAAFFEWIGALLLKQQAAEKKSLLLVMELFENALKASELLGEELDNAQQRALSLQTVNSFAALCSSVHATRVNAALSAKLARISELVMRFAQSACSLVTIQHVVEAVSRSVSFIEAVESSSEVISQEMRDAKANSVLSCMEAIVSEKLLQHPDLHKRSFGEWAGVLSQIADALAALITSEERDAAVAVPLAASVSNIEQRQRAKVALASLKVVLDQVPSLKQEVLAKASLTKIAYAALL